MKGKPDAQPIIGSKIFYEFNVIFVVVFFGVMVNIGIKEPNTQRVIYSLMRSF